MSGEQLAHPATRSSSLPFEVLLGTSDDALDADLTLQPVSRRFSSDPSVPAAARAVEGHTRKHARLRTEQRGSRRERVKALTMWYDRMASRPPPVDQKDSSSEAHSPRNSHSIDTQMLRDPQKPDLWPDVPGPLPGEPRFPGPRSERRDSLRKLDTLSGLQQEVSRLREVLTQEHSERMSLEHAASSLHSALQTSKQKVNEQKETICRLESDVQKAQSVAPCLKEIIHVSERHYRAKEQALKRVIQGLSAERDFAIEMNHKLESIPASHRSRASWQSAGLTN